MTIFHAIFVHSKKIFLFMLFIIFNSCTHFSTAKAPLFSFLWINERHELEAIIPTSQLASSSIKLTIENFSKHYQIKDDLGYHLPIARLRYLGQNRIQLITGKLLNLSRNYYLIPIGGNKIYAYPSRNYLNKYYYTKEHLGAKKDGHIWTLSLWSPTATEVLIRIYRSDDQRRLLTKLPLTAVQPGLWQIAIDERKMNGQELEGHHYQYEVFALGEKTFAPDPYSIALANNRKKNAHELKSTFIDIDKVKKKFVLEKYRTNKDILKNRKQFIGSEINIRDLTISKESPATALQKGTYLGALAAIPHFQELGITHVQVMPLAFFPTIDESATSYQTFLTPYRKINYNWGYDTQHFFSPTGFYSQAPHNPQQKVDEIKKMISGFQSSGIGVILDVVFNHLYDGESFEKIAPGCYLRRDHNGVISKKSGAGYSFESRNFMARRMIIDALEFWHKFYGVNGFRFDLMSFIDRETLLHARKRLGEDVIFYGEGWNFTDLAKGEASTMHNLPDSTFGAFNGEARDAIFGTLNRPGAVLGNISAIPLVKSVIVGALQGAPTHYNGLSHDPFHHFTQNASQNIIYLDIHDGPTLWDKADALSTFDQKQRIERIKQAYVVLLTSLGRPILHSGSEIGRSKKSVKNGDEEINTLFAGNENKQQWLQANSYRHWDETNAYPWKNMKSSLDITKYLSQVIKLRQALPHLHYTDKKDIFQNLSFFDSMATANRGNISAPSYQTFSELDDLTINFVGGPANRLMYLAGEIHPHFRVSEDHKNPFENPYSVQFNDQGKATLNISKTQLQDSDYEAWSRPDALNFKLIFSPGQWETIDYAYDALGNNSIPLASIPKNRELTIDLKLVNASSQESENIANSGTSIAYQITGNFRYKKVAFIHNFSNKEMTQNIDWILPTCKILLDEFEASIDGINNHSIRLEKGKVTVPANKSVIIATEN